MTLGPLDDYLDRLERELRQRGVEDARILDETREHLLDAMEDGRQRGLSLEDAARDAVERFGAPETVAAHAAPEGDQMMTWFAAVLDSVWEQKRWILAPTVLAVVITSIASHYVLPTRYRSESIVRVSHVTAESARPTNLGRSRARFWDISDSVLGHRRLESIIKEFNLYQSEQQRESPDELVERMRRDIGIGWFGSERFADGDMGEFRVSYVSADPLVALKITQRLTGEFIEENARESDRDRLAGSTRDFIDPQLAEALGIQAEYTALFVKSDQGRMAELIVRRTIGEQFRILSPPQLPTRPVGPSRAAVNVGGALAGLGLGLICVVVRSRSKKTSG
jgi:uncharacterized protein involved in exopolysaccharide biosynthesis